MQLKSAISAAELHIIDLHSCNATLDKMLAVAFLGQCAGQQLKFAHSTLQGHTLAGEERFALEFHKEDDSVW